MTVDLHCTPVTIQGYSVILKKVVKQINIIKINKLKTSKNKDKNGL